MFGFFNGVARFGSFVAALIGGFLTDLIGFETTVYAFAGVTLLGGLAVLRERPPASRETSRVLTRMPSAAPSDAPAIRDLFTAVFASERPLEHSLWKFEENPAGPGIGVEPIGEVLEELTTSVEWVPA